MVQFPKKKIIYNPVLNQITLFPRQVPCQTQRAVMPPVYTSAGGFPTGLSRFPVSRRMKSSYLVQHTASLCELYLTTESYC